MIYYNERDPYAAEWLRNLMFEDHIPFGFVDERDIRDVRPDELRKYTQCHFFAGIGVWSHALRRAAWADDRPIWTGSCPCQPFSAAGARGGETDERHLWPHWFWLIDQCRPPVVVGEQVASKDGLGWLDLVSTDMEGAGYAFGASDLCAAGFGGAHIRQRLYFVGLGNRQSERRGEARPDCSRPKERGSGASDVERLADDECTSQSRQRTLGGEALCEQETARPAGSSMVGGLDTAGSNAGMFCQDGITQQPAHAPMLGRHPADWLYCRDGKWRPVEPGTFPLADAAPARVGRLRAYGNALDEETATNFAEVVKEICDGI